MEAERRARLAEVMASMAAGDRAAVFTLHEEFGASLGAVLRSHLGAVGVERVQPDELEGLIIDACFELFDCAGAWDPAGGALPWNWAERRMRQVVVRAVGIHADSLDDDASAARAERAMAGEQLQGLGHDPEELEVLASLAVIDPACELLAEALTRVASQRDARLLLEVRVQASMGDQAPAVTVGRRHGLTPAAVRQAVKRTRDKVAALAAREPRFAPLADLALLA